MRKNGDIECYSGVLCVGELGGACMGWFSQVVDYSVVAVCSLYLCLFGEEREALGGVDGGGAVWCAGFGDWFYFCYEPIDRSTRSTRSTREFFSLFHLFYRCIGIWYRGIVVLQRVYAYRKTKQSLGMEEVVKLSG